MNETAPAQKQDIDRLRLQMERQTDVLVSMSSGFREFNLAADPKTSAGARAERKAFRAYLRRLRKQALTVDVNEVLDWVLNRQARYDRKVGGLGKR